MLQMIIQINELEIRVREGTSYVDCFKGTNRRRTEISCMYWIVQTLYGLNFMEFSTYFCKWIYQSGLTSMNADWLKTNRQTSPPTMPLQCPSSNSRLDSSESFSLGSSCLTLAGECSTSLAKSSCSSSSLRSVFWSASPLPQQIPQAHMLRHHHRQEAET